MLTGIRITTTFTCGWVGARANYITFTFACFIPQKLKWQSFVAAWYFGVIFFANLGGGGGQNWFFALSPPIERCSVLL